MTLVLAVAAGALIGLSLGALGGGGSILAVLHVIDGQTRTQIDRASDEVATNLLRMFGVPVLYAYIFAAWAAMIAVMAFLAESGD